MDHLQFTNWFPPGILVMTLTLLCFFISNIISLWPSYLSERNQLIELISMRLSLSTLPPCLSFLPLGTNDQHITQLSVSHPPNLTQDFFNLVLLTDTSLDYLCHIPPNSCKLNLTLFSWPICHSTIHITSLQSHLSSFQLHYPPSHIALTVPLWQSCSPTACHSDPLEIDLNHYST